MDLIKKAASIKKFGITGIILGVIGVLILIIGTTISLQSVESTTGMIFVLIISIILLILSFIYSITSVIMVLATDWRDATLNQDKILWGLLGLFLLGEIASIIFACKAITALGIKQQTASQPQA